MKGSIDLERIEKAVKEILIAIGEDPEREGLIETPKRVARMYEEVFEGIRYTNEEIANMFDKSFEHPDKDMVIMKNIPAFSYCEHHLALMYNMNITVAYIPNGKVIGLSKIARIVDMVTKRLQLQEKIGSDVAEVIRIACGTEDVAVIIEGEHSCMTARGIKKPGVKTNTVTLRGRFKLDKKVREELFQIIKNG
ncbi:MAG: GTP cyclohydrolase I FolE [Clostridia bacterium]|nr:GTP cyclohydrolase I FolE [Clostridia bacterium]